MGMIFGGSALTPQNHFFETHAQQPRSKGFKKYPKWAFRAWVSGVAKIGASISWSTFQKKARQPHVRADGHCSIATNKKG